jgi:uncharacterized membrane protein YkgB
MDSAGAPSGQAAGALQADDLSDEAVAAMFRKLLADVDRTLVRFMASWGITLLRVALGIVFVWFGALKLVGRSPVADLVAQTVYWIPPAVVVPVLGVWEVVVGLGLLARVALRVVLFLFWLQMAGTFLVLVVRPDIAFQSGNPLLLTVPGEFVIKNLVLIAAGLVIGSTAARPRETHP